MLPGPEPSRQREPLSRPVGCADVASRYLFLIGAEIGPAQAHAAGIPAPGPPLLPSVATRIALIARRRFSARSQIVPPANSNLRPISMRDNQFTLPGYLVIDHTSAVRLRAGLSTVICRPPRNSACRREPSPPHDTPHAVLAVTDRHPGCRVPKNDRGPRCADLVRQPLVFWPPGVKPVNTLSMNVHIHVTFSTS